MKLSHPESDQTVEPKAEHAAEYKSQGWVEADEKPAEDEKPRGK